jgi:hypothetical protein
MFARNVSLRLKPNTLSEFTRIFEKEVIPMLRKQSGFRDEIAFAVPGGLDVVAISLWDTKDYAEAYNTAGYSEERKILDKVLEHFSRWCIVVMATLRAHDDGATLFG